MYSNTASFGKICVLCIQKAPQSAVGECTARASCRQGAFSPSEALRSCTSHESCHPLTDLPLRRGCIDAHLQHCAGTDGPAPAQGLLPEQPHRGTVFQLPGPCAGVPAPKRLASTRHLPIPATRCTPLFLLFKLNQTRPVGLGGSFRRKGTEHVKELRYGRGSSGSATSSGLPSRVAPCPRLAA